jgi:cephalosporin-C deacetylase-like acetyl esterase
MFKNIRSFVAKLVVQRKVDHAHALVNEFIGYAELLQASHSHIAFQTLRDAANSVVAQTAIDPQPLRNLLTAVEQCVEHYGPGLKLVAAEFKERVDSVTEDYKHLATREQRVHELLDEVLENDH